MQARGPDTPPMAAAPGTDSPTGPAMGFATPRPLDAARFGETTPWRTGQPPPPHHRSDPGGLASTAPHPSAMGGGAAAGGVSVLTSPPLPVPPATMPRPDARAFRGSPGGGRFMFRDLQHPPVTPSKRVRSSNYSRFGFADTLRSPVVNVLSPATDATPPGAAGVSPATGPSPAAGSSGAPAPDPAADYLDAHFERERRLDRMDRGSFSEVYLVRNRVDGTLSAVKKLREPYRGAKDRCVRAGD